MIRFDLLGEIRLRAADGTQVETLLRQPKRLALLAYLVTPAPGAWHRRDILIALFWPELDAARARSSLRNALYVLRQSLGDPVLLTRGDEEVSVDPAHLETDVAGVWEALRESRGEAVLERYRGDLLPGLFPPDSEGFQRWLEDERTRLRLEVARAGLEWAAVLEREGRPGEALAAVRRVIELNPDDETAVRRLMALHDAVGDRAGGLNTYEAYRRKLAREFDATPAPETVALADKLRQLAASPVPSVKVSTPVEAGPLPPATPAAVPASRGRIRALWAAGTLAVVAFGTWAATRPPRPLAIGPSLPVTAEEGLQIEPAVSPNGRLVAYAKGTPLRMRIFVQRLDGGQPWALSGDTAAVELLPRWAPDNDQILFLARNGAYVSPAVGGSERLVVPGGEGDAMVRSASWSPNGDSVLIVRNDSLTVHPLDGVGSRFVGTGTQLHSCVWAPNRPWIACVSGNWIALTPGPLFGNRAPSSIALFPAEGGRAIDLTDRDHEYQSPAWSADGRFLWVLSNRDGVSGDVYAMPIGSDGRRKGPYVRVGLNAESISLASDRIAYSVPVRSANIWSLPIPERPPVTLAVAEPVTRGNQVIEVPSTSRDGAWLIHDSDLRGNADLYRIPIGGGPAVRLTDDRRPEYGGALSPDTTELAYHMWVEGERRLFVKDLVGGSVEPVFREPGDWGVPRWSPSGQSLAVWSHEREEGAIAVVHRDSAGRWQEPAWRLDNAQLPVWSPDGGTIAFVQLAGSIGFIPADSGTSRIVYAPRRGSNDPMATFLAWINPDDLWLLGHDRGGRVGIWSLPVGGGSPRLLVDFGDRTSGPALATDGRRFFFTLDQRMSNVRWAALVRP
jgi:DNA-binding SARP family transcriptional activator/Tol biopolymer transport system component